MKLAVTMFVTLDGVYQGPGGPDEDRDGGFTQGGWSSTYGDEDFAAHMVGILEQADAFLLGRRTYEIFSTYWPKITDPDDVLAGALNSLTKYVPSRTLRTTPWGPAELLHGDLADEVAALKARPGRELQVHGSGALAGALLRLGVVDTLRLLTFPVALGDGKRFIEPGTLPTAYALSEVRATPAGVVLATYERVGDPVYGNYEVPGEGER
ncbi:dihydrofolate reductase family protein [Yinghuangia soli]|uniref:Dihydrofolate reductase family protein n=1 Tax=Yinghuangia soli TaxID=2908204 RepID=A0AA41U174_9ACTN|nr:dihydrofolate reductase family protein [Yinghuangia soli]MCF2525839.1 dihydrofolate reductase family protein [Yinghuangia soli]